MSIWVEVMHFIHPKPFSFHVNLPAAALPVWAF